MPTIPAGWTARGDLPDIDPSTADELHLEMLDEDLLQIEDSAKAYVLDVGWYPAASREGKFLCRVVFADNWDEPLEETELRNRSAVVSWIQEAIAGINDHRGEPGEISTHVVFSVVVNVLVAAPQPERLEESRAPFRPTDTRSAARTSYVNPAILDYAS